MGLLTTYGDFNKVQETKPVISYQTEPGYWSVKNDKYLYQVYTIATRTRTESWRYVGMTEQAAQTCANDMKSQFTRRYADWSVKATQGQSNDKPDLYIYKTNVWRTPINVECRKRDGGMWDVNIQLVETDKIIITDELSSVEQLEDYFDLAKHRDDSYGYIIIDSAFWDSRYNEIQVKYTAFFSYFDKNYLKVEIYDKTTGQWIQEDPYEQDENGLKFTATENKRFRVKYSTSIVSNEWETHDQVTPTIEIDGSSIQLNIDSSYGYRTTVALDISTTLPRNYWIVPQNYIVYYSDANDASMYSQTIGAGNIILGEDGLQLKFTIQNYKPIANLGMRFKVMYNYKYLQLESNEWVDPYEIFKLKLNMLPIGDYATTIGAFRPEGESFLLTMNEGTYQFKVENYMTVPEKVLWRNTRSQNGEIVISPLSDEVRMYCGQYVMKEIGGYIEEASLGKTERLLVHAFDGYQNLKKVDAANIVQIDDYAFNGCTSLVEFVGDKVEQISSNVFNGCSSLASVSLNEIENIGDNAFNGVPSSIVLSMKNKTQDEIRAMSFYPWGLASGSTITAKDGTFQV